MEKQKKKKRVPARIVWTFGLFAAFLLALLVVTWRAERPGGYCYEPPEARTIEAAAAQRYRCQLIAPPNLLTACLVIIGAGGVFVALFTLHDISTQTRSIHHQAVQVKRQTSILINSERAWIMAQVEGDRAKWNDGKVHIVLGSGTDGDSTGAWIVLSCHNEGKSPAWIYEKRVKFEVVHRVNPEPDFDSLPVVFRGREPIGIGQSAIPNITKLHRLEIAEGHSKSGDAMIIYGIVKYRDIFDERRHVTFGYRILRAANDYTLERLSEHAYNDNT